MRSTLYDILGVLPAIEARDLADNVNTPPATLEMLSKDSNAGVRWAVAKRQNSNRKQKT